MKFTKETINSFLNKIDGDLKNIVPIANDMLNKLKSYHHLWLYGGYRNYDDLSFITIGLHILCDIYKRERINIESNIHEYRNVEMNIRDIISVLSDIVDTITASDRFNKYYEFYKTHKKMSDLLIEKCNILINPTIIDINSVASTLDMEIDELLDSLTDFKKLNIVNIEPVNEYGITVFKLGSNFYKYAYYIDYKKDDLLETPNSISIQDEEGNDD